MTDRDPGHRASDAKAILESEAWKKAWEDLRQNALLALRQLSASDDQQIIRLKLYLDAMDRLEAQLQDYINTGKLHDNTKRKGRWRSEGL